MRMIVSLILRVALLLIWATTALSQPTAPESLVVFNTSLFPRIERGETVVWQRQDKDERPIVVHVVGNSALQIDGTLIVKSGVRVVFHSKVNGFRVNGKLRILGRESCRRGATPDSCPSVVLESSPKSQGGDGYWRGIEFTSQAEPTRYEEDDDGDKPPRHLGGGSIIQHATIRRAHVRISAGAPYILDSLIEECVGNYGLACIHASSLVNTTLVVENTTIVRRREDSNTLSIRGSRNGKVYLIRCNVFNRAAFYGPDLFVNIFTSVLKGKEVRLSEINALTLQDSTIEGGGDIVGSNLAMNTVGGNVRPADLPTITIRRSVFHTGSNFRCFRCRRLVFRDNTILGGYRSFTLSRVSRCLIENNLWKGVVDPFEGDLLTINVVSGPFRFSNNVIANVSAGVFATLFRSARSRGIVEFRNNVVSDSSFSQGLLHFRTSGWNVTHNIFTNTTSPVSVSVAGLGLKTSMLSVPANHWGLLQADIVSGRRRTVLGDALGQLEGPLVDFGTVLVRPRLKKNRLRPAPIPSGLVRSDGSIGGLLRDGDFELTDRPNAVASLSLVVVNATLRIGPNVQLRFVNGGGIWITSNSSIVIDGGRVGEYQNKSFSTSIKLSLPVATTTRWWLLRVDSPSDIILRGATITGGGVAHDGRQGRIFMDHAILETKQQRFYGLQSFGNFGSDNRVEITNSIVRGCTSAFYLSRSSVIVRNSTVQCTLSFNLRDEVTVEDSNLQRIEISPSQAYRVTGNKTLLITRSRLTALRMWPVCEAKVSIVGNVFVPSNEAFSGIDETSGLCRENVTHRGLVFHDNIVMTPFQIDFDDPYEVVSIKNNVFRNIRSENHNYALRISHNVAPPSSSSSFSAPRGMDISGNVFDARRLSLGSTRFTTEWNILEIRAWPSREQCEDDAVVCSMRNNTFLRNYSKKESDPFKLYNVFVRSFPSQVPNDDEVLDISNSYWDTTDMEQIENYIGNGGSTIQYLPFRRTRSYHPKNLFPVCAVVNDCNNHGICNDDETCTCNDGWTGQFCETQREEEEDGQ